MSIRKRAVLFVLALLWLTLALQPLQAQSTPANPNAQIQWPPPTYLLSGTFPIYGTVNLPDMNGYFLEFRPLIDSVTEPGANVPWQPATLPSNTPIINGVLGQWNTTAVPDGLYELRLTVLTTSSQFVHAQVSPLRVQNQPSPFGGVPTSQPIVPVGIPTQPIQPTQPVQNNNGSPMARATLDANVRFGDSTLYAPIGALLTGQSAPVIGVSSTGSGWWLIQLPDGQRGWIAPTIVQITGDLSGVPSVNPPPPPTPIPTPIPTSTPVLLPDATITNVDFDREPKVNEQFKIIVTVADLSPVPLPTISVACNITPQNVFVSTYLNGLIGSGQTNVELPVTLTTGGGGDFTANCAVDINNLVAESAEYNNYYNRTTTLQN